MPEPLLVRLFLSSPGDAADERARARTLLERRPTKPLQRGRVTIEVVSRY